MPVQITIRDVPEEVRDALAVRAARQHQSMQAFLRDELERIASRPSVSVIEQYFDDKYSPSCLLFGLSADGRPLHLQVSYADTERVKIITLYEPDASEWIDFSQRR